MMEHTKEPWSYGEDNDGWYVEKDGTQIAHGLTETDTRRIVACVNICEGLDTELLETGISAMKSTVWTRMAIGRLRQQHEELLSALEAAIKQAAPKSSMPPKWVVQARAAIAKAGAGGTEATEGHNEERRRK